jgi:hypothetical protein
MGALRTIQPIRHGVLLCLLGRRVRVRVPDTCGPPVKQDSEAMEPREQGDSAESDCGDIAGEGV